MNIPLWASVPFLLMLLAIALGPLVKPHWWERNYPWVALALGAVVILLYLFYFRTLEPLGEVALDYFAFICLIGSLFVVTGGILIRIEGVATPFLNTAILLVGAVISNVIGTTGASMLLIRPFLRLNKGRFSAYLVVFFIFLVSNIGGALTPIGDPPLFLGFLKGVPFFWLIPHVWLIWLFTIALLLIVFYFFDVRNRRGLDAEPAFAGPFRVRVFGLCNLAFLGGIILAVLFLPTPWRELAMIVCALASFLVTRRSTIHQDNAFTFGPIREVAILFAGIFITMLPALAWLRGNAQTLGLSAPGHFYWTSGALSSFLDNAPTYLSFLNTAIGYTGLNVPAMLQQAPQFIVAISLGSVFFGANTYIGNGPNFMVKSISETAGVKCPSFLGYMARFSIPILIPIFALVWLLFLR
ncbi:MAG: sodium:proton antiporter [Coprothermobacterota bacterium]|nr:sodium:proton antiporter [Coprothermobacterota bacterium]